MGSNVPAKPQQVITTVGATHALDIVSRTLLRINFATTQFWQVFETIRAELAGGPAAGRPPADPVVD